MAEENRCQCDSCTDERIAKSNHIAELEAEVERLREELSDISNLDGTGHRLLLLKARGIARRALKGGSDE